MRGSTFIRVAESVDLAQTFQEGNCSPCCHFEERSILRKQRLCCGRTMSNVSRMRHYSHNAPHLSHVSSPFLCLYVHRFAFSV